MLKAAVIILVIMLAYGCVYSLVSLLAPKVTLASSFEAITEKALDSVKDTGYLKALKLTQRGYGLFALTTTIAGFFVLFFGFRKAQRWAWWTFLVVGGIAWLWGVVVYAVIGDTMNLILYAIGIVIFLVGLLIPIKEFFGKKAEG